jgi:N-acetylmuramic acid 6-phosphate etherase
MLDGSHRERALEYLRVAHLYRLGNLPTEQPHPATRGLSDWARFDLPRAVRVLKEIDLQALGALEEAGAEIDGLTRRVRDTLAAGRRVYLCGCGATGRLSLSLEFLWRRRNRGHDGVRAFMAGGDVALVHSLEGFEDHPEHGARHLVEMGFVDGDLLISCTEGGETPYVIGATNRAAEISSNRPYFLYCNSDDALTGEVARFRRVRENPDIHRICLDVGPMALAGSTRMQASTVLQMAVGLALLHPDEPAADAVARYRDRVERTDFAFLAGFVEKESDIYAAGDSVLYRVRDYGITVFTDTTERAPTFSLVPFDQLREPRASRSLCYVVLEEAGSPADAWHRMLSRAPRPLGWPEVDPRTTPDYLHDFDFSVRAAARRRRLLRGRSDRVFGIRGSGDGIGLRLDDHTHALDTAGMPALCRHLVLKQALNIHSTLVMGRLGRYESNLMTWVSPTNGKLVDRAARYVTHLVAHAGRSEPRYEDVVVRLFAEMERARPDESIVLRTARSLMRQRDRRPSITTASRRGDTVSASRRG